MWDFNRTRLGIPYQRGNEQQGPVLRGKYRCSQQCTRTEFQFAGCCGDVVWISAGHLLTTVHWAKLCTWNFIYIYHLQTCTCIPMYRLPKNKHSAMYHIVESQFQAWRLCSLWLNLVKKQSWHKLWLLDITLCIADGKKWPQISLIPVERTFFNVCYKLFVLVSFVIPSHGLLPSSCYR